MLATVATVNSSVACGLQSASRTLFLPGTTREAPNTRVDVSANTAQLALAELQGSTVLGGNAAYIEAMQTIANGLGSSRRLVTIYSSSNAGCSIYQRPEDGGKRIGPFIEGLENRKGSVDCATVALHIQLAVSHAIDICDLATWDDLSKILTAENDRRALDIFTNTKVGPVAEVASDLRTLRGGNVQVSDRYTNVWKNRIVSLNSTPEISASNIGVVAMSGTPIGFKAYGLPSDLNLRRIGRSNWRPLKDFEGTDEINAIASVNNGEISIVGGVVSVSPAVNKRSPTKNSHIFLWDRDVASLNDITKRVFVDGVQLPLQELIARATSDTLGEGVYIARASGVRAESFIARHDIDVKSLPASLQEFLKKETFKEDFSMVMQPNRSLQ